MNRNKRKNKRKTRAEPLTPTQAWFISDGDSEGLCVKGYTKLSDNPEVRMGIERIADLISTMTIYLMENGEGGDIRLKNELSRKIDIEPYKYMTRQQWVSWIVKELILNGNAIVYPKIKNNIIDDLTPIPNSKHSLFDLESGGYYAMINGKKYSYDEILHFRINPNAERPWIGESYRVVLSDVVKNLKQAAHTTNQFMSNKIIPNLIIKVDALTEELISKSGKEKVYDKYISASKAGEPWIIPADLIDVQQVKPLTLNDIAIKDTIELDKKTVAGILGIPVFLLGLGTFNEKEYNNFIQTRIRTIATAIEQELTMKLLYSPKLYFKFNVKSLYSYSIKDISNVYTNLYTRGVVTGNEVRAMLDMSPMESLNELIILENFIPADKIGNQEKLNGGETSD
ncbi:MAG: phage portal protein [Peptoniphilus sp.]|uniref:phage portal protein n=1 Tax=Peptoniphilus sp. TaxID=1971214 RepID=UPI002A75CC3D|nr:phage portal protein [Peptoniphilus sp.]MDY2986126.1 phage portal protein [Peptoniphilus sp.]